ncbi:MAG: anhydro-N-acetylmuramic acid kinase, partial [Xanthobacteraceae bacterium]
MSALTAIGLMSGTSFDGIDVALIETDGETIARLGPIGYRPYAEEERRLLQSALPVAAAVKNRADRTGALDDAERLVTGAHFQAVEAFLRGNGIAREKVDIVGFHGQTVLHRPAAGLTVQIGDGAALASQLRIPVVYDFRAADMESSGEGAPLVPIYHRALARQLEEPHPIAVLNVGGVANVTYIDGDADPIAFDTGPGNAPIDEVVFAR